MNELTRPGLVLALITVIAALCLGTAYSITKEPIAQQLVQTKNSSMQKIFPSADEFKEIEFDSSSGMDSVDMATASGELIGYVVGVTSKGYGGDIKLLVAVDLEGVIAGLDIITHNETPGLGAKADSETFLSQYKSKSGHLNVVKQAPQDNEIHALTSATVTTNAVTSGVNSVLEYFNTNLKGVN